ncbi:hypothetical protein [Haloplanus litoreus]|uniref:Uncharacterized protein n=1 Tax=Haloplanus litoreus TaxID=767515 RepID=A0ABD5ZVR9_9EURY
MALSSLPRVELSHHERLFADRTDRPAFEDGDHEATCYSLSRTSTPNRWIFRRARTRGESVEVEFRGGEVGLLLRVAPPPKSVLIYPWFHSPVGYAG